MTANATASSPKRLIAWNINGLRAVYKKEFLTWVATEQPDLLFLQETKIQAHQLTPEMIVPPIEGINYHTYYSHAVRPGYSGVSLWSKIAPLSVQHGFGHERFDSEGRTIIADYPDYLFCGHYYPNGGSGDERLAYKLDFYAAFLEYLKPLNKAGKPIIVTGDFNTAHQEIDLARPKENVDVSGFMPIEREALQAFMDEGFIDTFRHLNPDAKDIYTWWHYRTGARARNVGWRIDYFFINQVLLPKLQKAQVLSQATGSDHCPVELILEI